MFIRCIKNYFSSLRYVFSVLGIMFLALLIGGGILYNGTKSTLNDMTSQLSETTGDADLSTSRIWTAIKDSALGTDYKGNDGLMSGDEMQNMMVTSVSDAVSETVDNYTDYLSKIGAIISNAIMRVLALLVAAVMVQIVGFILSRSFVLIFARSDIASRNVVLAMTSRLIYDVVMTVYLAFVIWVYFKIPYAGLALLALTPVIYCILTLVTANFSLGKKRRIPMKQAIKPVNVIIILLVNIIELVVAVAIGYAVSISLGIVAAVYVNLALVVVASVAVSLSADSAICYLAEKNRNETEIDESGLSIVNLDESEASGLDEDDSESNFESDEVETDSTETEE